MNVKKMVSIRISEICIGVKSVELIQYRIRRVIWLQTATVFWLGVGNIYLSY
jgi:hypothetical protein